jgi:hypothetical protein
LSERFEAWQGEQGGLTSEEGWQRLAGMLLKDLRGYKALTSTDLSNIFQAERSRTWLTFYGF